MKNILFALLIAVVAFTLSCGPKNPGGSVKGKSFKTGVWIDDDTFRMVGMGIPMEGSTNVVQRKRTAQEAAELDAQYRILQKFIGAKVVGASGMKNFQHTGTAVAKEASGMIRGGNTFSVTWDAQQNCEVVYEVKSPGLKKKTITWMKKNSSSQ